VRNQENKMMKIICALSCLSVVSFAGVLEAMEDACERNVAEACYELGSIYQGNDGIPADDEKADKYLTKACELGHDKSCLKWKKISIKQPGDIDE